MSLVILSSWLHLVTLVFLVGYALFWTVVLVPVRDAARAESSGSVDGACLELLARLRFPPFGPLRLPLAFLGWLGLAASAATGLLLQRSGASASPAKLVLFAAACALHAALVLRPHLWTAAALVLCLCLAAAASVALPLTYRGVLLALHLWAVLIWLGHMFFWSFVVGPSCKRHPDPAQGALLRERSHRWGALGGPALLVLLLTGTALLVARGSVPAVFPWKLALVGGMAVYQVLVGHRRAPRLVQLNMLAALVILYLSVRLVHEA